MDKERMKELLNISNEIIFNISEKINEEWWLMSDAEQLKEVLGYLAEIKQSLE